MKTYTKLKTAAGVLAVVAALFISVQFFGVGSLLSHAFGTAAETRGSAGPMGPEPHAW